MRPARIIWLALLLIVPIIVSAQTLAAVPNTITYQGGLSDLAYTIVPEGEYEFTFLIFDGATSGNLLWSETHPGVPVSSGTKAGYKASLGESEPLEFSMFSGRDAWLEVRIFGEIVAPRRRIVSVPFALKAEGEVPEGGIILGQNPGDAAILDLGYTQEGGTVSALYPYKKKTYAQSPARVPTRIAYQGRLEPLAGATMGSTADLTFTLFDADTLGSAVWSETQTAVPLRDWLFSVELGAGNSLNPTHLAGKDRWLSVSYKGQTLSPRQKLTSAAYALKIQSPVPPGGIVLSATNANPDLTAKKFTPLGGVTVKGRYPFIKSSFLATDPSVPLLINYQGRLTDPIAGLPLSADTITMRFALYDASIAGNLLYSETINDVPLSRGLFDVLLGAGDSLTPNTFSSPDAYLSVTLTKSGSTETLSPRQRLTSVPFALTAEGAMPPTTMILGSTTNDSSFRNAGFQMTGDTIKTYYLYAKTDVDTTPPTLTIVAPTPYSGFATPTVPATITFTDSLSGIDLNSFQAFLDGVTVTSSFTLSGHTATATLAASLGENILNVRISDRAGNLNEDQVFFYMDSTGTPPSVAITSPQDGVTLYTDTPRINVQFYDHEGGINLDTFSVTVNGQERGPLFSIHSVGDILIASWQVTYQYRLQPGPNTIIASIANNLMLTGSAAISSPNDNQGARPPVSGIRPAVGFAGDTVTISGSGFSNTLSENVVNFDLLQAAQIVSASPTQLQVLVPPGARSGNIGVTVNGHDAAERPVFSIGQKYGFVANYDNPSFSLGGPMLSVIAFDGSTPGRTIARKYFPTDSSPFDVALSPDGKRLYMTDWLNDRIHIFDATLMDANTAGAQIETIQMSTNFGPRFIKVSPDGLETYVGSWSSTHYLYVLKNDRVINDQKHKQDMGAGYTVNKIACAPAAQRIFVTASTGTSSAGEVKYLDIDKSHAAYLQGGFIQGTSYYNPVGVTVKPDQSEVYVANNNSDGGGDAHSFSIFDVAGTSYKRSQGATILPGTDFHDVTHPYDLIFDPRGRMFYSSFQGSGTPIPISTSNNIGAQRWPAASTNFEAGTSTDVTTPYDKPRGLAFAPGGKLLFAACYGLGNASRSRLTILDNDTVKAAIDGDSLNSSYALRGPGAIKLEDPRIPGFPNVVRPSPPSPTFDGPQSIVFQEFPLIELVPSIMHLAKGGVAEDRDQIVARIHPIYGVTVRVGLSGGSTVMDNASLSATFHEQWLGQDRRVFSPRMIMPHAVTLAASKPGIEKIIADVDGYPSNVVFVTIPPQNVIQGLYAEPFPSSVNELTIYCLAAVIRNRNLFPLRVDIDGLDGDPVKPGVQDFYFPFSGLRYPPAREQFSVENTKEELIASNLNKMVRWNQFNSEGDSEDNVPANQYWADCAMRSSAECQFQNTYDICVRAAGDIMIDLLRTSAHIGNVISTFDNPIVDFGANRDTWRFPDHTLGSIGFVSLTDDQWSAIQDAYNSQTSNFPTGGGFANMVDNVFPSVLVTTNRIQVVVVQGLSIDPASANRPQFVFLRLRKATDHAVIKSIP